MSRKNRNRKNTGPSPNGPASSPNNGDTRKPSNELVRNSGDKPEPTWLEKWTIRISRWLGSLQIAVILLSIFATVLAIGTMVESWYSGHIAQELVYRAWWFTLLLFLLGINIFFAAAKKWPWKRHQTGFLITHVGLLTMLAGGILTSLSGTDAAMTLLDSASGDPQGEYPLAQSTNQIVLTDDSQITVKQQTKEKEFTRDFDFAPGSFAWHADDTFKPDYDSMLTVLNVLAHPLPHFWECEMENGARLQILNYYPHARQEPFSPSDRRARDGFPAIKVQLASPQFGRVQSQWLALYFPDQDDPHRRQRAWPFTRVGPAMMELLGLVPTELLDEFKNPPGSGPDMKMGQLVLRVDGKTHRFYVAANMGQSIDLGNGKQLKIVKYIPNSSVDSDADKDRDAPPFDPVVEFELTSRNKTAKYRTCARANTRSTIFDDKGKPAVDQMGDAIRQIDLPEQQTWYHPPDQSFGSGNQQRGVLQFVQSTEGKLYYRSFHQVGGILQLERPGEELAHVGEPIAIWAGMKWRFYLQDHLTSAKFEPRLAPENARPGLEKTELSPAIRCKLTNKKDSQEFWILLGHGGRRLQVGGDRFTIDYGHKLRELDFDLKLLRAEQTVDPGTQSPASYSSFVQLSDSGRFSHAWVPGPFRGLTNAIGLTQGGEVIEAEDHWITMNAPLNHRGYKVYQSQYEFRGFNEKTDKPVNRSGFTVGRDPGLWLKYAGSTMLALGIATMFYMRAYFFKPRSRSTVASAMVEDAFEELESAKATATS